MAGETDVGEGASFLGTIREGFSGTSSGAGSLGYVALGLGVLALLLLATAVLRERELIIHGLRALRQPASSRKAVLGLLGYLRDRLVNIEVYSRLDGRNVFLADASITDIGAREIALDRKPGSLSTVQPSSVVTVFFRPVIVDGVRYNTFTAARKRGGGPERFILSPPSEAMFLPRRRHFRLPVADSAVARGLGWLAGVKEDSRSWSSRTADFTLGSVKAGNESIALKVVNISAGGLRLAGFRSSDRVAAVGRDVCLLLQVFDPAQGAHAAFWAAGKIRYVDRGGPVAQAGVKFVAHARASGKGTAIAWESVDEQEGIPELARIIAAHRTRSMRPKAPERPASESA